MCVIACNLGLVTSMSSIHSKKLEIYFQASAGFSATAFIKEELDDVSEEASLPEAESDSTAVATEMTGEGEEGKEVWGNKDSSHITSVAVTVEDSKTLDRQAVSIRSGH